MAAEKCPVCEGAGKLNNVPTPDELAQSNQYPTHCTCHGCNGRGWINPDHFYTPGLGNLAPELLGNKP